MSEGIYHWKLGDVARARICKKVYANVQVIKNDEGLFYDYKVLGISGNTDGTIAVTKELCYYVETLNTKNRFWLPYTNMFLAERSRPFYGPADKAPKTSPPNANLVPAVAKKRKIKEDLILPLNMKPLNLAQPDLNLTYDVRHTPLKQGRHESTFKEFIRRGKDMLFDQYYEYMQKDPLKNRETLDYLINIDTSTEDKFETVIKDIVSEKEIEHYLHQCWRYNNVDKQISPNNSDDKNGSDNSNPTSPTKAAVVHIHWCLVCGKGDRLLECSKCPSSFHLICRREWLISIIHRKILPKKQAKPVTLVEKILSSTRTICTVKKEHENMEVCPSCMWGPKVGYGDVVWHKLGQCAWWPARVLTPGSTPSCLLQAKTPTSDQWPLRYYGTLNHSWGDISRMCLFLPSHANTMPRDEVVAEAVLDACDDYITVYLT